MKHYDPEIAPDPEAWLELDELERIQLVERHHRAARIKLPNANVHAVFHAMVENQIAEGLGAVVAAMARLMGEGLSRHDALHAIGSVSATQLYEAMKTQHQAHGGTAKARYEAALERLTARQWLRQDTN